MSVRRIARIPSGPYADGRVVCFDDGRDSLPDMYFYKLRGHQIWEFQGWNQFKLVYEDTDAYQDSLGVDVRDAIPYAAGDVDNDGLTDILCVSTEEMGHGLCYNIVMTLESPDRFSYPCSLSWYYRCGNNYAWSGPADLMRRQDSHVGIIASTPTGTHIWENVGDNQNQLKWTGSLEGYNFGFRDFNQDGRNEIATGWYGAEVWEDTGSDQYEMVWRDTLRPQNGPDVWSTADIDGDGRPEFYESFFLPSQNRMYLYMYQDESSNHQFTRTLVDSLTYSGGDDWGRASAGGDIDGDGIDECIWTTYDSVRVYKAFGNNDLRKVWDWRNDHHDTSGFNSLTTTVYDVNGDGYNELLLAGNGKISIFEVDAVDLVAPTHGSYKVGDTVPIRWATHSPPRCDSLSLFLRLDSLWNLQTIVTGLPGSDTVYRWVVPTPSVLPDTGRIVVMAYGPGHQWDMSDSVITFSSGGVAEGTQKVPLRWSLSVSPNPARGAFSVRYDVPDLGHNPNSPAELGYVPRPVSLGIYDVDGRLVRSLSDGRTSPGRYEARLPSGALSAGIYFLRLDAPGFRDVKKAVVTR
ncbi:MAG TPA: FG-GAP-like repeat-containing protein [bacterium]|nr:FG-GAP-like repeat-containing protein [bacterium]